MNDDPRDPDNRPRLLRGPTSLPGTPRTEASFYTNDETPRLSDEVVGKIASIRNPAASSILYAAAVIAWCCAIVAILALPAAVIGAWRILL